MPDFLDDFEWQIDRSGYQLVKEPRRWKELPLGLLAHIQYDDAPGEPMLVVRRMGGNVQYYRPLQEFDTLYSVFAGIKNPDDVLHFIEKFGSLTYYGALPDKGDVVWHVLEQAAMFRDWLNRARGDRRRLATWMNTNGREVTSVSASLIADASGALRLRLAPRDLLSGLWLQLAMKLSGTETIRACLHCGHWFEAGHGTGRRADAKFCSDKHRVVFNSHKRSKERP